ncbi:hypothetical protein Vretimale_17716 [Volvox reticuliferus]|uniref:Uncharacterized protein n=1 Tax=Volvox reticuliferus TaxID=1737510 RepID=A0A8J4GWD0_9CHLO|nr:hypothetical protein Vretifemale_18951 [Volvox reticuliferus]GIM14830.1 hypothetical protein Vretimale_17716 [Volvox reticuliferus]
MPPAVEAPEDAEDDAEEEDDDEEDEEDACWLPADACCCWFSACCTALCAAFMMISDGDGFRRESRFESNDDDVLDAAVRDCTTRVATPTQPSLPAAAAAAAGTCSAVQWGCGGILDLIISTSC